MNMKEGKTAIRSQSAPVMKSTPRAQSINKEGASSRGKECKVEFSKARKP